MSPTIGSVKLESLRHYDGALGIGIHALDDSGALGLLARDPLVPRSIYKLLCLPSAEEETPGEINEIASFTLELIHRADCAPESDIAYVFTDSDVYLVENEPAGPTRKPLLSRLGEIFLSVQFATQDANRSAVILTQDRASTSFTLTRVEAARDKPVRTAWTKSWGATVQSIAISGDGSFIAVGQDNGNIVLLDRERRIIWAHTQTNEPILAISVDYRGCVVAATGSGLACFNASDGEFIWRLAMETGERPRQNRVARSLIAVNQNASVVLCAYNTLDSDREVVGSYFYVDGKTGDLMWDDSIAAPITGVSLSPSGEHGAISCRGGDIINLRMIPRESRLVGVNKTAAMTASELFANAQKAYGNHEFAESVRLVREVFQLDPALHGSGSLYDDASWHLRQTTLNESTIVSAQSLALVEHVLELLPNDERLVIRRNALARLLAEQIGREAAQCVDEELLEDAISKYMEALSIDPAQTDLRNALRMTCDHLAISLLKQADAAFHEDRFDDAIEQLERVQELRPGEPAVTNRLEHARGLEAFAAGMKHYIRKSYYEAAFWFRKALVVFPDHAEALRYLAFAENFNRQPIGALDDDPEPSENRFELLE